MKPRAPLAVDVGRPEESERANEIAMKDLLDKLSSYNVFNYLFPGVLVAVLGTAVSSFKLLVDNIVIGVFLYYFYGLVISRIGSLVLEPVLKRAKVVRFAPYADFVAASHVDEKLETLSEQNNVYRTLASTFLCLILLAVADWMLARFPSLSAYGLQIGVLLLLPLFIWSYRKQTKYISARVAAALRSKSTGRVTDSERDE